MDIPILDLFEDESLINKETVLDHDLEMVALADELKTKGIDTVLFVFARDDHNCFDKMELVKCYEFKNASNINLVYNYKDKFLIARAPLGGPSAGGFMEELGFLGIKNFFACGSAGLIDENADASEFVLPIRAIRDEGTSYHYLKPSVYAETDAHLTNVIENYLKKLKLKYNKSTTWTTDAFYRETKQAVEKRKNQGAVCVEMECASWCAIAQFRGYKFAQLLYFSDVVKQSGHKWHANRKELRQQIINLMIDCVEEFVDER